MNYVELYGQLSTFGKLTMVVAVGVFGLAAAYLWRPTEQKLVLMRPVSLAAIFATISGLIGGWIALLQGTPATTDVRLLIGPLSRGLSESLVVGFVSFGFLAAAWMLVAVGMLRRGSIELG